MYYSSGNYEAFARPKKPEGVDNKSAYIVGSGLAALSALVLFAPPQPYPVQAAYKIATALGITAAAFGRRGLRRLLTGSAVPLLAVGCAYLLIPAFGHAIWYDGSIRWRSPRTGGAAYGIWARLTCIRSATTCCSIWCGSCSANMWWRTV